MELRILFVNFCLFLISDGFLLDDRTQPPTTYGQAITDTHFNMLMDLLTEERHARLKQSKEIFQLKKELIATQQGVTAIFHASHSDNDTLNTEFHILKEDMRKMFLNYSNLQNEYNLVKAELNVLKSNNSETNQLARLLEQELSNVQQLKGVANLQTILNLTDDAKRLEHEQQVTNSKMSSIANDVSAMKQDFIAFFNKTDLVERSLNLAWKTMETNFSSVTLQMKMSESRFNMLENMQNLSTGILEMGIHTMSDRVAVTACAEGKYYSAYDKILFPYFYTKLGVTDTVISSMKTYGIFKCEKPGLYFVSSYVTTNDNGYFSITKNGDVIGIGYFSLDGLYETSTIVELVLLSENDTLSTIQRVNNRILGNQNSCFTILQLTG